MEDAPEIIPLGGDTSSSGMHSFHTDSLSYILRRHAVAGKRALEELIEMLRSAPSLHASSFSRGTSSSEGLNNHLVDGFPLLEIRLQDRVYARFSLLPLSPMPSHPYSSPILRASLFCGRGTYRVRGRVNALPYTGMITVTRPSDPYPFRGPPAEEAARSVYETLHAGRIRYILRPDQSETGDRRVHPFFIMSILHPSEDACLPCGGVYAARLTSILSDGSIPLLDDPIIMAFYSPTE